MNTFILTLIRNAASAARLHCQLACTCAVLALISEKAIGSDHADPIDPLNRQRQEGALTDLFAFPILKDDMPAFPFKRPANLPLHNILADIARDPLRDEDLAQIDAIVFILCVRRQLTDSAALKLNPYTYRIHIDVDSTLEYPTAEDVAAEANAPSVPHSGIQSGYAAQPSQNKQARPTLVESFARYGGKIVEPNAIREDITMEFRLTNEPGFQEGYPKYSGPASAGWKDDTRIKAITGVFDDPFIFPAFFGTNVVAIVFRVPIDRFPKNRSDFLIWANSLQGKDQIDHVGRSLRTQNPRFELLNTLHPSQHVRAITEEHENPKLMRDILLRLNFGSLYGYRAWDFVPDVMCFSKRYPVGYPNGRLLTDDVAAVLAQLGDTLLYELSYQDNNGRWPRQMTNDGRVDGNFNSTFPYLLAPSKDRPQPPPRRLTTNSILKLLAIAAAVLVLLILENWLVAYWYCRRKLRRRYL